MHGEYCAAKGRYPGGKTTPMAEPLPEALARSAARQVYRLLRLSAPLLRPVLPARLGIEQRARAVTALVRIGWNGAAGQGAAWQASSAIAAPERLCAQGVACIGHPTARSWASAKRLRATATGFASGRTCPSP